MVNRRQFFKGIVKRQQALPLSEKERKTRCQALETHVQAELLPTHYALSDTEQSQLSSRIRSFLNGVSDADLISTGIVSRLKLLVEDVFEPWQMGSEEVTARKKPQELRFAAIESVPVFLNTATEEQINFLMERFGFVNRLDLEVRLREDVAMWIQGIEDRALVENDNNSIQERVFGHLNGLF